MNVYVKRIDENWARKGRLCECDLIILFVFVLHLYFPQQQTVNDFVLRHFPWGHNQHNNNQPNTIKQLKLLSVAQTQINEEFSRIMIILSCRCKFINGVGNDFSVCG